MDTPTLTLAAVAGQLADDAALAAECVAEAGTILRPVDPAHVALLQKQITLRDRLGFVFKPIQKVDRRPRPPFRTGQGPRTIWAQLKVCSLSLGLPSPCFANSCAATPPSSDPSLPLADHL